MNDNLGYAILIFFLFLVIVMLFPESIGAIFGDMHRAYLEAMAAH